MDNKESNKIFITYEYGKYYLDEDCLINHFKDRIESLEHSIVLLTNKINNDKKQIKETKKEIKKAKKYLQEELVKRGNSHE